MRSIKLLAAAATFAVAGAAGAQAMPESMQKAACTACHAVDKKMVGPAYKDVAKKYQGDAKAHDMLVQKVRKGGAGVWGPVPMPPNGPDKISDADLDKAITWVLSQK